MRAIQRLPLSRFGLRFAPGFPLLIELTARLVDHGILRATVLAIEFFGIAIQGCQQRRNAAGAGARLKQR